MEILCRKCGLPVGDPAFGSPFTGWEHVGGCPTLDEPVADVVTRVHNRLADREFPDGSVLDSVRLAQEVERLTEERHALLTKLDEAFSEGRVLDAWRLVRRLKEALDG